MASKGLVVLGLSLIAFVTSSSGTTHPTYFDVSSLNRDCFPSGFVFGAGSASYQVEGAASEGGKGPSMWDYYIHKYPEKMQDRSNGDVAIDQYHRYKEDMRIMKNLNMDAYRFSISWPRLLPTGKLSGGLRKEGIDHYNSLIDEIIANGMKPFVTIFHWDVPQALEEEFGGFLSPKIIPHFEDYAETCFKLFGDRVKLWVTLNEPKQFSVGGYAINQLAPWRCSPPEDNCTGGNSGTEPYFVGHYLLLAHAKVVKIYRDRYQSSQEGLIGITLNSNWVVPYSDTELDKDASLRLLDFTFGWFMDPVTYGDYPNSMRNRVGKRLPTFRQEESELLKGSYDFLGLNYYTSSYAKDKILLGAPRSYTTDTGVEETSYKDGKPIGERTGAEWLCVCPQGIYSLLNYTREKYNDPVIYITENGYPEFPEFPDSKPLEVALYDTPRIDYYRRHLDYILKAIVDGAQVKGFFGWSAFDSFEWGGGFTTRMGITYIDYNDGLKRIPKLSAHWFKAFLERK